MKEYIHTVPRDQQDQQRLIRTFTGRYVDPFNLKEDDICIKDIAHHLSNECRFSGAGPFYSVAQHSVLVSWQCLEDGVLLGLAGLLHDAAEAYFKDLPSPVKHAPGMEMYRDAEEEATSLIFSVFDVPLNLLEHVKPYDNRMFENETRWFWGDRIGKLELFTPRQAEEIFLAEFDYLTRVRS